MNYQEIYIPYISLFRSKFITGMACNWHDYDERPQFCSLQKIKSWAYVMSKHCCEDFQIDLISGRHRPVDSSDEQSVISYILAFNAFY